MVVFVSFQDGIMRLLTIGARIVIRKSTTLMMAVLVWIHIFVEDAPQSLLSMMNGSIAWYMLMMSSLNKTLICDRNPLCKRLVSLDERLSSTTVDHCTSCDECRRTILDVRLAERWTCSGGSMSKDSRSHPCVTMRA